MIRCGFCGYEQERGRLCDACGMALYPAVAVPHPEERPAAPEDKETRRRRLRQEPSMPRCRQCGVMTHEARCPGCGVPVPQPED